MKLSAFYLSEQGYYHAFIQLGQLLLMYYFLGVFPWVGVGSVPHSGTGEIYSVFGGREVGPRTEGKKG